MTKKKSNLSKEIALHFGLDEAEILELVTLQGAANPNIVCVSPDFIIIDTENGFLKALIKKGHTSTHKTINKIFEIAGGIADLPSDELKPLDCTEDLEIEFHRQRNDSIAISRCFIYDYLQIENANPLKPERLEGKLNHTVKEYFQQTAYYYRALYDLILVGFKDIKKAFPDMPFTKASQLFIEIVKDERNYYFEKIKSSQFLQIRRDDLLKFWQGYNDKKSFEELNKICVSQGLGNLYKGELLHSCFQVLEEVATKKQKIRSRLAAYNTESKSRVAAAVDMLSAKDRNGNIKKSIEWKRGNARVFDRKNRPTIRLRGFVKPHD